MYQILIRFIPNYTRYPKRKERTREKMIEYCKNHEREVMEFLQKNVQPMKDSVSSKVLILETMDGMGGFWFEPGIGKHINKGMGKPRPQIDPVLQGPPNLPFPPIINDEEDILVKEFCSKYIDLTN